MAGIKDVAKMAGVSVGTVSRAINKTGYVSETTLEKVKEAMRALNYVPNELARNLYRKKTGIVALLVPAVSHPFFSEFVNEAEIELHERGFKTMICNTNKEKNYEQDYLEMLKRHIVDGVITGVHSLDISEYLNIDRPIVALDRYIGEKIPVVAVNHQEGGIMAAKEFRQCGCKSVTMFREAARVDSPARERYNAFEKYIREHTDMKLYAYELDWNQFNLPYFNKKTLKAFEEHPDCEGVFGTDLLALSYMKTAMAHGKHIPDDLKVVAYDGTYVTEMFYPGVTVIKQPIHELAKETSRLIANKIEGKEYVNRTVELKTQLIHRESTAIIVQDD